MFMLSFFNSLYSYKETKILFPLWVCLTLVTWTLQKVSSRKHRSIPDHSLQVWWILKIVPVTNISKEWEWTRWTSQFTVLCFSPDILSSFIDLRSGILICSVITHATFPFVVLFWLKNMYHLCNIMNYEITSIFS